MPPESGRGVTGSRQHAKLAASRRAPASFMTAIFRDRAGDVILGAPREWKRKDMDETKTAQRSTIGAMFGASALGTFLGLPKASIAQAASADVAVLGAPAATPYASVGPSCAGGPGAV